ncbi:MAG: monovalent cation/H+ antiporter subunit D family protein [Rhodospirillales bacterium]|nr:monovalent cation/H+ antiporter subunit D family protein [Rhodospirillales bacterium]MDP6774008.1 monovalent cation/H+ antiporter subunit D family protein [Rhodospirillales bacterium]
MSDETTILLCIATPLAGAVLIAITGSRPNLREAVTLVTAGVVFGLVASLFPQVLDGGRPAAIMGEMLPGLAIAFEVEPLGMMFAGIASFLWIVTSVYSIGYMRGHHEHNQTRFYIYFAVAIASAVGVAFAANMMTLFVFYEVLTLSTFPLVTHHGTDEAKRAGRVYLGILLGTSIGLQFIAVIWTWTLAGTLDFTEGGILRDKASPAVVGVLLALYVFGIGKAAVMPFHRWLPAAMVAPTPVSALLHAVAVVKAGVFTVLKVIVYIFGFDFLAQVASGNWLLYVSGFTIVAASVVALRSDNLKRRLAYSTVSQLSYVIMAAAILTPLSAMGAALHIATHAFGKITLFFCAGSILVASHKTLVSELDGIGRRMPWTMAAFAIGAFSMIGIPPTVGFVSKWYILRAAMEAEQTFAAAVIVLSTLLNAGYFLPIVYAAFFRAAPAEPATAGGPALGAEVGNGGLPRNHGHRREGHGEAPLTVVLALTVSAAGILFLFFFPDLPFALARQLAGVAG